MYSLNHIHIYMKLRKIYPALLITTHMNIHKNSHHLQSFSKQELTYRIIPNDKKNTLISLLYLKLVFHRHLNISYKTK